MEILLSPAAWLAALLIFGLRLADMALDTLRLLFVVRGKKKIVWVLGFFQSILFVIAITSVLDGILENPLKILGYGAGFATGNVLGIKIEEKLAVGHLHVKVVSPKRGLAVAAALRDAGFAVTEVPARGLQGTVTMLLLDVMRRDLAKVETSVLETDHEAFVTVEDVRPLRRGFWGA